MIYFALIRIWNRKLISISIIFAFISLYVLIPLGLKYSKESKLTVEHTIEAFGRGSYDILVRPGSSRMKVEQSLGMVEENYIGDSQGGISITEWKKIKQNPDIEVAAPAASIGYFSGSRLSVGLPQLKESTRFTWQFYTSDGIHDYPLNKSQSLIYFKESIPGNIQYLKKLSIENGETTAGSSSMEVMLPSTYHLLAGIDIESEQKLTKIDYSELNNDIEQNNLDGIKRNFGDVPIIKVIQRKSINIPVFMKLKTESLEIDISEYRNKLGITEQEWMGAAEEQKRNDAFQELLEKKPSSESNHDTDLSSYLNPFNNTPLQINENFEVEPPTAFASDRANTPIFYTASKLNYKNLDDTLKIDIIKDGNPPSYKKIEKKGKSLYDFKNVPYLIEQVGTFSTSSIKKGSLTSSPLGIYATTETKTEKGTVLKPTTIPGSFIPQPAGGLTTLEAAEIIKGNKPIDSIRVRVAGIESYNEQAQKKIEKIATNLLNKGYDVDIVAGSSFKKVPIQVEGIGKVIEPWTTLGTAQELSDSWNIMSLITTCLFILFGVIWLFSRLIFEKNILTKENDILYKLGWLRRNIVLRNSTEFYILMTIAYIITNITFIFTKAVMVSYLFAGVLWAFSILFTTFLFTKKSTQEIRTHAYKRFPAFMYYRRLIVPTMLLLSVSSILIGIQITNFGYFMEDSSLTSMGEYTLSLTFWINITILLSTLILASAGISECFHSLLTERKAEIIMFHTIGWNQKRIFIQLSKEITTWGLISIIFGLILGVIILFLLGFSVQWIFIGLLLSFVIMTLILFIFISINSFLAFK